MLDLTRYISAAILLATLSLSMLVHAQDSARPNIVWIIADDMSPDMGCYGDAYAWTPNLDRLATQGARYTRAFAVNGQCAPSRAALITGMYPTSIGTHNMRSQALPPSHVQLVSVYLRAAGYFCSNNGKADYNLGVGRDELSGIFVSPLGAWDEEGPSAHWSHRDPGQAFFAVFNLAQTHESRLHLDSVAFEELVKELPAEKRHEPGKASLPGYYPDNDIFRADWARYYDTVSAMDIEAGAILNALDADGLAENTAVFFFGDHGRPLPRAKRWLYDSGLHVPLIVRWPGRVDENSVNMDLISFVDFAPTVLKIADIEAPPHMQGKPFLADPEYVPREYVFGQRDRVDEVADRVRSVRAARYHYIRNFRPEIPYATPSEYMDRLPSMKEWRRLHDAGELSGGSVQFFAGQRPAEEFYDTQEDPQELRNLISDPNQQERITTFREQLIRWIQETADLGEEPEPELNESWRPSGQWSKTATPIATPPEGIVDAQTLVALTCATEGAVIEYKLNHRPDPRWHLYTKAIPISRDTKLRVRAGRLGFQNSDEKILEYSVK